MLELHIADIEPDVPRSGWSQHWMQIKQRGSYTERPGRAKGGMLMSLAS